MKKFFGAWYDGVNLMQAFHLNAENFSDMHAELEPQLQQLKIERNDILNAELLVEEIFWRMV